MLAGVATVAAGCSSGSVPSGASTQSNAVANAIRSAVSAMAAPTPPGLAIAVYYHGNAYYFYQGVRAVGGMPVDRNTIFELGSLTKSFTGIMLGAYVNQGTAGVTAYDHPVRWIDFVGDPNQTAPAPVQTTCAQPSATPVPPADYGTVTAMTLLQLATHTSGIPYTPPPPNGDIVPRQCYSPQQLVNYVETGSFPAPPAPWVYSNVAFGILGYVLQGINARSTGQQVDWYTLVRQQIIDPLGMAHTYDLNVPVSEQGEYAQGYTWDNLGNVHTTLHWTWDPYPSAGVLRSTAPDMMKYLKLALGLQGPAAMIAGVQTAEKIWAHTDTNQGQGFAWEYEPLYPPSSLSPFPPDVIWKDGATAGCSSWIGMIAPSAGGASHRNRGIDQCDSGCRRRARPNDIADALSPPLAVRRSDVCVIASATTQRGSWLLDSGIDLATFADLMGHSKPTTTLNYYAHSQPGRGRKA